MQIGTTLIILADMSTPTPDLIARFRSADASFNVLGDEIVAEKASSLGHHGRHVEKTLAALKAFDPAGAAEERTVLLKNAAYAVWAFFVQRELCGLRDQKQVIRHYGIPGEVLARLGAL